MTNPVAQIRTIDDHGRTYEALAFVCPGCESMGGTGLHILPVAGDVNGKPQWSFDGNLDAPTLSPSILTRYGEDGVCHSFMRAGRIEFLSDCTHDLVGQTVDLPPLPGWFVGEGTP